MIWKELRICQFEVPLLQKPPTLEDSKNAVILRCAKIQSKGTNIGSGLVKDGPGNSAQ